MFLRATVTFITAMWHINKHYWRVYMPSEGRAGLEGVCQRDVVICLALTGLFSSSPCFSKSKRLLKWPTKFTPCMWKNTRCYKIFLVKHLLLGALAWQTVDVRHKPFLFSLHLTCAVFQQGAPSRPGRKHCSGRCDVPTLPAPVSLLLLFLAKFLYLNGFVLAEVGWFFVF